ncbi:Glycosyl transferase, family 2 [Azotobacter vinelandii CA]|uniref:Glycosyl transferase, family 2 n=2 Tax=Azotobacter vinelandii TaxID=354 RepID=C1DF65_AZOVD|nr:bacteriohopanetetrol glucosamine biosynthesis glycosyltransferase HpnI [Azotobacter vinelandii]ACO78268.1 Glycosyl transferase, family 2 [Azotobacter vinelandii DJ]AGK15077.1 Glycosyl transferase, family 2 [Azotobacter vinelandii CA]AGK20368.1 Glycosyl transferase, family 2 [Azotobacter vinelandii CA6]WKN23977.1 bacteriohopanetetrol glucosamine biosynthesis glycosyltransferase HpnI [Azotobacter vinelandii]SFY28507.1 ceramide glucosyltransferase [Azotobacter vinelandii]
MPTYHFVSTLLSWLGTGLAVVTAGYAVVTLGAALRGIRDRAPALGAADRTRPVSMLKPLHGAEPRLYENLRDFCRQTHPDYQLIFGVREADDHAIAVVHRLCAEFPHLDIDLVIDPRVHGANLKVSNLLNMLPLARHDWLVLADSDISVPADYLVRVTAPLADPGVGIVTCLYYGVPQESFWSRLGALFIDDWFAPSVRLSHVFGSTRFAFGSTIALRREVLQAIGGFEVLRDTLADDFWLGELTRRAGLRTVLSDLLVGTEVSETRLIELWTHELRWLRTIRAVAPTGFALSFVCFTWPVSLLGLALNPSMLNAWLVAVAGGARVARFFFGQKIRRSSVSWYEVLLTPFRDLLLLLEWAMALTSWRVEWRGRVLHACKDGPMRYL